jgi:hypothetical protein
MSTIIEYLRQLAPVYERRDLLNTLTQLQDEHKDTLTPLVTDLREVFGGFKFRSETYGRFEQALRRHVNYNQSAVDMVLASLEQLQKNYPFLEKEVKRLFSIQFSTANITYDRVNLMRYIESASFYVRFARKLLLVLVAEEAVFVGKATPAGWSRAEREYLLENMSAFAGLFTAINLSESDLRNHMARVSNAEVNEETYDVAIKSLGNTKLDPMRLAGFSPQSNWVFSLGKAYAEWQVKRYKASVDEHLALQLRLQELRELAAGGNASPKLQRLIQHTEQRIEKIDFAMSKILEENSYA